MFSACLSLINAVVAACSLEQAALQSRLASPGHSTWPGALQRSFSGDSSTSLHPAQAAGDAGSQGEHKGECATRMLTGAPVGAAMSHLDPGSKHMLCFGMQALA